MIQKCILIRNEGMYNTNLKPLGARFGPIAGNPWGADNSKERRIFINFKIYFHFSESLNSR